MAPVSVFLTREQMLAAQGRKFDDVELPELGGKVRIASLSARAGLALRDLTLRQEKGENVDRELTVLLLREGIVDDAGAQLFTEKDLEQFLGVVGPETAASLVTRISSLMKAAPAKPAEGAEGNSQASPSGS